MASAAVLLKAAGAKASFSCGHADIARATPHRFAFRALPRPLFEGSRLGRFHSEYRVGSGLRRLSPRAETPRGRAESTGSSNGDDIKPQVAELKEEAQALKSSVERAEKRIERLEKQIDAVAAAAAAAAANGKSTDLLEQRLVSMEQQKASLEQQKAVLEQRLTALAQVEVEKLKLQQTPGLSAAGIVGPSAKESLRDFWLALPRATWSDDGRIMTLADGTSFLGSKALGNKLFNCDCYGPLDRLLDQLFAGTSSEGDVEAVAILGNPGIGKSIFGYKLLHRWACEGRRVVVVKRGDCPTPVLLTVDGAYELDRVALRKELDNPDVRYLVDGLDPSTVGSLPNGARMVLITSPNPDVYQEVWKRKGYTRLYMDVWAWPELAECSERIHPEKPIEDVLGRYHRWGGIPRYVVEKVGEREQGLLEKAIDAQDFDLLVQAVKATAAPDAASHKVLHLRAGPDFMTTWMEPASDYVSDAVVKRLARQDEGKLRRFLVASAGDTRVAGLRGLLWESYVHEKMAEGGEFRTRNLATGDEGAVTLPPTSSTFEFTKWKEVEELEDGRYFRPVSGTKPAVDSGMQPDKLFQVTVANRKKGFSEARPMQLAGLKTAITSLKKGVLQDAADGATDQSGADGAGDQSGAVKLYFVVPSDTFPHFKGVPIAGPGSVAIKKAISQYSLEITCEPRRLP